MGVHAGLYNQSKALVDGAMKYMALHNNAIKRVAEGGTVERKPVKLECIQLIKTVPFPRDDNKELTGMIHPAIDGKDFFPLKPGDPIFSMFDGSEKSLKDMGVEV